MIDIKQCTIELDEDSTRCEIFNKNKIKASEHKGYTNGGVFIHFFTVYKKDKKGTFFGYYTPREIIMYYGTFRVIHDQTTNKL